MSVFPPATLKLTTLAPLSPLQPTFDERHPTLLQFNASNTRATRVGAAGAASARIGVPIVPPERALTGLLEQQIVHEAELDFQCATDAILAFGPGWFFKEGAAAREKPPGVL
jgi:hypothetical protein